MTFYGHKKRLRGTKVSYRKHTLAYSHTVLRYVAVPRPSPLSQSVRNVMEKRNKYKTTCSPEAVTRAQTPPPLSADQQTTHTHPGFLLQLPKTMSRLHDDIGGQAWWRVIRTIGNVCVTPKLMHVHVQVDRVVDLKIGACARSAAGVRVMTWRDSLVISSSQTRRRMGRPFIDRPEQWSSDGKLCIFSEMKTDSTVLNPVISAKLRMARFTWSLWQSCNK